jgi:hypothetical protein
MHCNVPYTIDKNITKDFNMEITTEKTKIMADEVKYPIHSKIFIYNKITELVNCFKYRGYYVTYENEKDIAEKLQTSTQQWE